MCLASFYATAYFVYRLRHPVEEETSQYQRFSDNDIEKCQNETEKCGKESGSTNIVIGKNVNKGLLVNTNNLIQEYGKQLIESENIQKKLDKALAYEISEKQPLS